MSSITWRGWSRCAASAGATFSGAPQRSEARGELDTARRKEMYAELQRMIWEDGGEIIPMFNNYLFGAADNLEGFVEAPVLTGLRVAEQVWFA